MITASSLASSARISMGQAMRFRGLSSKPERKPTSPSKKASARRAGASQAAIVAAATREIQEPPDGSWAP